MAAITGAERYRRPAATSLSRYRFGIFERFTEPARQVVVLAQDEARSLKHNYIGTEHLLLGLLREGEGLAAHVLASLDITLEGARAQVARVVGEGDAVTSGQIPFTPRAKKVLELALREALSLGHNYIGTEHLLLGLVRENDGVAARIMLDFDADAEKIRDEIIRMLSGAQRLRVAPSPSWVRRAPPPRERRRWEYHLEPWPAAEGADRCELLNALGAEGWTLVGITTDELIFQRAAGPPERPLEAEEPPADD